jgi:hypothetical protein
LMQEPELDENALRARIADGQLSIERHAIKPADPATRLVVTDPDGGRSERPLPAGESVTMPAPQPGLWRIDYGDQHAFAAASPADAVEYADLRATASRLRRVARSVHWLQPNGPPTLGSLGLRHNQAMRLTGIATKPLLPTFVVLPVWLLMLLMGWRKEGR